MAHSHLSQLLQLIGSAASTRPILQAAQLSLSLHGLAHTRLLPLDGITDVIAIGGGGLDAIAINYFIASILGNWEWAKASQNL